MESWDVTPMKIKLDQIIIPKSQHKSIGKFMTYNLIISTTYYINEVFMSTNT